MEESEPEGKYKMAEGVLPVIKHLPELEHLSCPYELQWCWTLKEDLVLWAPVKKFLATQGVTDAEVLAPITGQIHEHNCWNEFCGSYKKDMVPTRAVRDFVANPDLPTLSDARTNFLAPLDFSLELWKERVAPPTHVQLAVVIGQLKSIIPLQYHPEQLPVTELGDIPYGEPSAETLERMAQLGLL